jgi:hypothetical protein
MPSSARSLTTSLQDEGRLLEAIDTLTRANRRSRDPEIERDLVRLRNEAFDTLTTARVGPPPAPWPGDVPRVLPDATGLATVQPARLTLDTLRDGIQHHGCLYVPRLIEADEVHRLVDGIDRAFAACDRFEAGEPADRALPWFAPFRPRGGAKGNHSRKWVRESGGLWAAESPRVLFDLLEIFERLELDDLIEGYLGERPVLSMNKCTLRRVPVDTKADWHQDGAFLGEGIRTVNVWLALSDCGIDAPGLDVVPRRLPDVVETGTGGAIFDWAVGQDVVDEVARDAPVLRPHFNAGDVLLFDHLFLHRTAVSPTMTRERHAIETWCFAPSVYPGTQVPLVW